MYARCSECADSHLRFGACLQLPDARHAPPDDDNAGVIGAVERVVNYVTTHGVNIADVGRQMRSGYKSYKEDEAAQRRTQQACSPIRSYLLTA
jgi:hypothetical protein